MTYPTVSPTAATVGQQLELSSPPAIDNKLVAQVFGASGLCGEIAHPLTAIARRLIQIVSDYCGIAAIEKNSDVLISRINEFVSELDQLHPVTLRPLIAHRHFQRRQRDKEPEAIRLLNLVLLMRHELASGRPLQDQTKEALIKNARQCKTASGAVESKERSRDNWIEPVIKRANELKKSNPRRSTSAIAGLIENDTEANPTGKKSEAIRKVLNLGKNTR